MCVYEKVLKEELPISIVLTLDTQWSGHLFMTLSLSCTKHGGIKPVIFILFKQIFFIINISLIEHDCKELNRLCFYIIKTSVYNKMRTIASLVNFKFNAYFNVIFLHAQKQPYSK